MMRRHFLAHRWVWLAIAITVVVANELMDRNFFDHKEHIDGDVVVTLLVLLLSFFGSYAIAKAQRRRGRVAT
jgi:multisubunit Na+/H+ antiporter MnhG subunit